MNLEERLTLARQIAGSVARKFPGVDRDDLFGDLSLWLVEKGEAATRGADNPGAMLNRAMTNAAINLCRGSRTFEQLLEDAAIDYENPEDIVIKSERDTAVRSAVLSHSPEAAAIFHFHFEKGQPHSSVAWSLGMPERTYYRVYDRILDDLRVELEEWA